MSNRHRFWTTLDVPFEIALAQVKEALRAEGFGVLTEIDVGAPCRRNSAPR